MVWRYCSVNDTFKSIYEHWAGNEGKSLGEVTNRSSHCLVMLQFPPAPLFMRYLFCHILAMKTVAMENTQRSRHGECSSSWQLRVFTNRLQFSRRQCKRTKEERAESVRCELAQISINKEGPWGWLENGRKKQLHCWTGVSAYCHHDTTREAGRRSLCVVRWTRSAPNVRNLCKGRWLCLCQQSAYFYLVYTSKMTSSLRLFITVRTFNKRKSALIFPCQSKRFLSET